MPDLPPSVHRSPFDYDDPDFRAAADEAKDHSAGCCRKCGRELHLEAHHYGRSYPPASKTKASHLTALCRDCHDEAHDFMLFLNAGGSPVVYRAAVSEVIAILLRPVDDGRRVGRAVWFDEDWAAIVSGGARPRVGEVFWLAMFSKREWVTVAVTAVIDGRPGHWRVRKLFLGDDEERRPMQPMCVTGVDAAPSAPRQAAA